MSDSTEWPRRRARAYTGAIGFSAAAALVVSLIGARADGAPAEGAPEIRKGPFLQALGPSGVTVKIELSEAGAATLEVTGPGGFSRSVSAPSPRQRHALRIEGLEPATAYQYAVIAGGAKREPGRFTTAPAPGDARPFRFLVYGDNRTDHVAHAAVVRAISAVPSDFLVHTGDMVQSGGSESEWQQFFAIEGELLRDRCVFAAVGNHELTAPDASGGLAFLRYFASAEPDGSERAQLYGSFRWSNTRFFLLNAMDAWTGEAPAWLRGELARSLEEPGLVHRIAVLHHGPFSSGKHGGNARLVRGGLVDLLREHRVELVFAGHDHTYERGEGGGLKYIISGGGGAPLYPRRAAAPETQVYEAVHHFVEVAVDGDRVKMVARRASGGVIEQCSFQSARPGGDPAVGGWECGDGDKESEPRTAASSTTAADVRGARAAPAARPVSCGCDVPGMATAGRGGGLGRARGAWALPALGLLARGLMRFRARARARVLVRGASGTFGGGTARHA